MMFEFPAYGTKQVEKSDLFWGDVFWDSTPNRSTKFKHHEYLENVNFEETNNAVSILELFWSLFHRVMTIVHKSSTYLHFWNFRISHSTYPEIQAFWLVEQQQQRLIFRNGPFWQGKIKNVWAYNSKDIIAKFNFLAPFSAKIIA